MEAITVRLGYVDRLGTYLEGQRELQNGADSGDYFWINYMALSWG